MTKRLVFILGATLNLTAALVGQTLTEGKGVFDVGTLHQINVSMSKTEWDVLQTSGNRGTSGVPGEDITQPDGRRAHIGGGFRIIFPWVRADLRLNGREVKEVGLRYKGNNSFIKPTDARPFSANLKVKTDFFGGKEDWNGVETLNFNAGGRDPSLQREVLSFAIFRAAGVPAPRTAYAELTFNVPGLHDNAKGGNFVLVENVSKQFLKRALPPGDGLLMKPEGIRGGIQSLGASWPAYVTSYRPERDATPHEQQRVIEFAGLVSQTDVALFRENIGKYLDVDEFLRFIAVHLFIMNNDSYLQGNHNYYLYLDPRDDKIRFIPWDQDLAMGGQARGGINPPDILKPAATNNALIYWLLDDPAVMERYQAIVKELSATAFSTEFLTKTLEEAERAMPARDASTKNFLLSRAASVKASVAALPK
jgi:spore coat protein CotH